MINNLKNKKGITLIALVVTIIVLIILAGVSINLVLGDNGIITRAKEVSRVQDIAEIKEQIQMKIAAKEAEKLQQGNSITQTELETILSEYGTINYEEDETTIKSISTEKRYEILLSEIWEGTVENDGVTVVADGSWNGTINTPKTDNTGLIPVYWDEETSTWVDLKPRSSQEEWNKWYNYTDTSVVGAGKSNWANARSKDGSMWVWIPRYEYKIDSENKIIDVRFISTDIKSGALGYVTDSTTGIVKSSDDYIVHPAFMRDISDDGDDTNDFKNGGWDKELPGFWVAKYEAGFQNATAGEEPKTVEYSNVKYSKVSRFYTNYFGTLTVDTTQLSYPVFKADTYSYSNTNVGDAWLLSQEIGTVSMYGLSNVYSHMLKNSEWGAVAYLTHSKYGVNGSVTNMNEVTNNQKNLNNTIYVNNEEDGTLANIYAVTSYGKNGTPNDVNASSTKNMTGVFDLNGGADELVAGFFQGGASRSPKEHNAMASSSTTVSTKYLTLYTANDKVGDALNETAGWNGDNAYFVSSSSPIFQRGDSYYTSAYTGLFAFDSTNNSQWINTGFRVCLAF